MALVLWVLLVPSKYSSEVVCSVGVIIEDAILGCSDLITIGVADTSWLFNVKHVCFSVPRVVTFGEGLITVFEVVRSMFLSKTKHGGAARTTIEPDDQRIFGCISLTL